MNDFGRIWARNLGHLAWASGILGLMAAVVTGIVYGLSYLFGTTGMVCIMLLLLVLIVTGAHAFNEAHDAEHKRRRNHGQ